MRLLTVVVSFVAAIYLPSQAAGQTITDPVIAEFSYDPFDPPFARSFVNDVEDRIRERFGTPETEGVESCYHHDPMIQVNCVWMGYGGLRFKVMRWQKQPKTLLQTFEISSSEYLLKHNIRIGDSRSDVFEKLGVSDWTSDLQIYTANIEYTPPTGIGTHHGTVSFRVDTSDRIETITWQASAGH